MQPVERSSCCSCCQSISCQGTVPWILSALGAIVFLAGLFGHFGVISSLHSYRYVPELMMAFGGAFTFFNILHCCASVKSGDDNEASASRGVPKPSEIPPAPPIGPILPVSRFANENNDWYPADKAELRKKLEQFSGKVVEKMGLSNTVQITVETDSMNRLIFIMKNGQEIASTPYERNVDGQAVGVSDRTLLQLIESAH